MPTGYTSKVIEGESFEEFALHTTTAFSYLARSLQESGTEELPDPSTAGSYHKEQLAKAEKRLKACKKMSFNAAAKRAQKEFEQEKARIMASLGEVAIANYRLTEMLKKVQAYRPPATERHAAHKQYMVEQLEGEIGREGNAQYHVERLENLKPLTGAEWKEKEMRDAQREMGYAQEQIRKETDNLTRDVEFIAGVRAALKTTPKLGR